MSAAVTRTKLKWFWAWDAPKEEAWLEQMASEGWHLISGGIVFTFAKDVPAPVRYRLDYYPGTTSKLREYITLCKDAGWDYVCRFAGWHYFRTSNPDAPELHTDPASLADRYEKLLALLIILLALNSSLFHPQRWPEGESWDLFRWAFNGVRAALLILLGYAVFRVASYIRKLKSDSTGSAK